MSTAQDVLSTVLTSLGGASALGLAAAKVWAWWTTRDATTLAARAKAAADASAATATERTDVLALLRAQVDAGEARAERSAQRSEAIAAALTTSAAATADVARAIERVPTALNASEDRISMRLEHVEMLLVEIRALLSPATGEHRTASTSNGATS